MRLGLGQIVVIGSKLIDPNSTEPQLGEKFPFLDPELFWIFLQITVRVALG